MAMDYTEEQLNKLDKDAVIRLFLAQQSQLKDIDAKLQLLLEQAAVHSNNRFGRSSCLSVKEQSGVGITACRHLECQVCKCSATVPSGTGI